MFCQNMRKNVELIMFDLDGTLANTGRDLATSVNYVRSFLDLEPLEETVVHRHVGHGPEHLLRSSLPEKYGNHFDEVLERFLNHYGEHLLDTTVLYPNVKEILDRFSDKKKIVVTNKRQHLAVEILRGLEIEAFFEAVLGGDSGWNKKPDPSCLKHVLATFKVERRKALIVGDGHIDIEAGRRAGVYTCGVTYGLCGKEDLIAAQPDFLIDNLRELTDYIR